MLLLTATTEKIQLILGSAASVDVHVSYVDNASGTITVGSKEVLGIVAAGTTDICDPPSASAQRNVKTAYITNTHATTSTAALVVKTTGAGSADLIAVTLGPGENLNLLEDGRWRHLDKEGAEYTPASSMVDLYSAFGITGTIAETIPRMLVQESSLAALTSGTLLLTAIYLRAGQTISNISFFSAGTASASPTNQFFALYDGNRNLLAQTANFTTEAWAANTIKTKALTSSYKVTVSGLYYVGIMVAATTVPTLKGLAAKSASNLVGTAPILHGNSSTGLTTAMPNPAAAITAGVNAVWASVS